MPGRNLVGGEYRFGFNGMEQDDEVRGQGNSLDFGSRIYNPQIGRWLSIDPLQQKYPQISPYSFSLDNPIFFIDPDGRDVKVSISRNEGGGGTITLSSDIFVEGENAAAKVVEFQKFWSQVPAGGTYIDEDGNEWAVKLEMNYQVATDDDIQRITEAKAGETGDNLLKIILPEGGRATAGHRGDNYKSTISFGEQQYETFTSTDKYGREWKERRKVGPAPLKFSTPGNIAHLAPDDGGFTAIHEKLHLIGLGDRYSDITYTKREWLGDGENPLINFPFKGTTPTGVSHEGFEIDVMGKYGMTGFDQTHVNNLAKNALLLSELLDSNEFIMNIEVDDADHMQSDVVPQQFQPYKNGKWIYSDPAYKKVK